jgi:hypothetical protein
MSSMAQQARPIGIGQSEFLRIQLMAASSLVMMMFPSILESNAIGVETGVAWGCMVGTVAVDIVGKDYKRDFPEQDESG